MKKIIALFVFMLAFGLTANAQKKQAAQAAPATETANAAELAIKQASSKDLALLMEVVELDTTNKQNLLGLFEWKHRYLAQNLSNERKAIIADTVEAKMKATLTPDQNAKLATSPALLEKLKN